jgi:hypothetical protein
MYLQQRAIDLSPPRRSKVLQLLLAPRRVLKWQIALPYLAYNESPE